MFNDKYSLTQAVLDGRKTMTRRGCKYDRQNETYDIVFPVFEPNDYDNEDVYKRQSMSSIPPLWEPVAWMPIPSLEGILEANKDVLERIKEKGD